ncbi:ArsC/Spx/MgsR family protein [Candidatus Accumulibacter phosphatis]|uniref:Nitrogenase-associated protein NifO n=1 Tax=Candidatus Accumulibacter phosphatis TaxID=327160 RepID=A0A5S4EKM4_9PROT|nr:ArsC/Spx/MgsR family protein [Candidatus Accumulibacter phosphatis]TMQ75917.1 Nitrogenase-associated protein NifO [Candidatus Accumulibacter phosphatis]
MAEVVFYEKAGCAGNARQKALLVAAGHQLVVRDLRDQFWSNVRLLEFLGDLPVTQWFNPVAQAIKAGTIVPYRLDERSALALLRHNPLLIRRPLLQVGEERRVGFDVAAIDAWIGLRELPAGDLEACQRNRGAVRTFHVQTAGGAAYPCRFDEPPADASRCRP